MQPDAHSGTPVRPEPSRGAVLAIAGATLVAHLAVAWRHGFFRDELYFIDCGRHPAFGYVDQPPLVPLVAAATQLFGHCLVALRAVAGLAHAGTVVVCAALAGLVADEAQLPGRFARRMAAIAVAVSPMFLGLTTTLNTTTFEPFAWTYLAYAVTRAIVRDEPRLLVTAGAVAGLALEAKYAVPLFLVPLIAGVALGPARRILVTRQMLLAIAFGAVLAATILLHGKDYYAAPAYGVAFALGAVAIERLVPRRARSQRRDPGRRRPGALPAAVHRGDGRGHVRRAVRHAVRARSPDPPVPRPARRSTKHVAEARPHRLTGMRSPPSPPPQVHGGGPLLAGRNGSGGSNDASSRAAVIARPGSERAVARRRRRPVRWSEAEVGERR